jgi:hypothetical protein
MEDVCLAIQTIACLTDSQNGLLDQCSELCFLISQRFEFPLQVKELLQRIEGLVKLEASERGI